MFSKKREQNSPTTSRTMPRAGNSTFSVIGLDVVIRGNIEASADLHVDGKVIGNIACAALVTGEASMVEGEITAESARISGTVAGTVRVRQLVILKSARIDGDVSYETLSIEQGAGVNGRFAPLDPAISAGPARPTVLSSVPINDEPAEVVAAS